MQKVAFNKLYIAAITIVVATYIIGCVRSALYPEIPGKQGRKFPDGCMRIGTFNGLGGMYVRSSEYWWLTNDTLLLFHCLPSSKYKRFSKGYFSTYNIFAHEETVQERLTTRFFASNVGNAIDPRYRISFDGKLLTDGTHSYQLPAIAMSHTWPNSDPAVYQVLSGPDSGYFRLGQKIEIKAQSLKHKSSPIQVFTIFLPFGTGIGDVVYSPRGDKIAWLLGMAPDTNMIFNMFRYPGDATISLWISNIDGSNMHEIGYYCVNFYEFAESAPDYHCGTGNVQWSLDETRVSFIHNNTLFAVNVY